MTAIELRDVHFAYGQRAALNDVSLTVAPGTFTGLLGPNGAGKSTLIHLLSGGLWGYEGSIRVLGREVRDLRPAELARLVAVTPQRFEPPSSMTVLDLVLLGRHVHAPGWNSLGEADAHAALDALEAVDGLNLAQRQASGLSGGELSRVLLARALVQEPQILLLDELASGLDPGRQRELFDLLAELLGNRAGELTILTAIHDLNLAALYCGNLALLTNGRLQDHGPTADTFTRNHLEAAYGPCLALGPHPQGCAPQAHLVPGRAV